MKTGSQGTFVISWAQTDTDGVAAAPIDMLSVGVAWRWTGVPVRVDGPQGVLVLIGAEGAVEMRRRAARMVRRLIGAAFGNPRPEEQAEAALPEQSFVVTDGSTTHVITVLAAPDGGPPLLMVLGQMPPVDCDLWVVQVAIDRSQVGPAGRDTGGVICFTPGTWLDTPRGPRLIEDLVKGDHVLTRDNGPQTILWRGQRRMTGARLHAMPQLRPIRFRRGAMGSDRPAPDLWVSPQHRMLVTGPAALALFNTPEVLVAAEHLINDSSITVDYALREVTYIHILLGQHNIIWANGVQTESFHPANAAIGSIDTAQRADLLNLLPGLAYDAHSYGDYARRNLSAPEAAILQADRR